MLSKLIQKLWSLRAQFIRYFVVGIGAVILDIWSLRLLLNFFSPILSVIINQLFILNFVFFLNKHWSFGSKGMTNQQMVRFYLVAGMNYAIGITWMWLFTAAVNLHPYLSKIDLSEKNYVLLVRTVNVALAVSWNFLLYKYFVYREKPGTVNNLPA